MKSLPGIDLIVGPDNIPELPRLLADLEHGGLPKVRTVFDVDEPSFLTASPEHGRVTASAFVTVMKGCNERCSYCIVPYTRGPERYRSSHEVLDEVRKLVENGVREITLLGQTVNSYLDPSKALPPAELRGDSRWKKTSGKLSREDETEFPALLRRIASEVPELARLRYTSPHPRHLTPSLIRAHHDLPMLCRHVHLPVQSGSDSALKRMIRRYSREEYIERTLALKEEVPGLTLSTDVIVGFPGETDEEFEDTLDLVRTVGFVGIFGFTYSQRPYTPALKLVDDVSEEEKGRRLARLFALVDEQKAEHLATLVGKEELVLLDGRGKTGDLMGRTERNEIVHLRDTSEVAPADAKDGAIAVARIGEAFKNSLAGELVRVVTPSALRAEGWSAKREARTALGSGGRRILPVVGHDHGSH